VEDALEEIEVALSPRCFCVDLEDAPGAHACTAGSRRRTPTRRRELAVRVHVPLAREQDELVLRELGVDQRERHAVEREIPRRVPGYSHLSGIEITSSFTR
jgi:hypothetical protein